MSNKKTKLKINKFDNLYGGKAHPSLIYEKTKFKTYKSLKFGTTKTKHTTEINPIQKGVERSYVNNRPFEGTRKDYGDRELLGLQINPKDISTINQIKKKQPHKTARAKRRYVK